MLGKSNILMYSTHNEGEPVIAEMFIKTLKTKIYKKMPTNDRKSYLGYLNKLVSQCKNNYHQSFNKNPINASCSTLIEKLRRMLNL